MNVICRFQMGPFGMMSWRALRLSVTLSMRLLPDARHIVTHQGPILLDIPCVEWHPQVNLYSHGRFEPERFDPDAHELWQENDHIMWALSPGLERWLVRDDATLAWIVDWDYYGTYAERVGGFRACPGMYGLPPGLVMPMPPLSERGQDQEEQGFIASWLREHPPHEIVTHDEVSAYMPNHDILRHTHSKLGSCGVHLPGLNRGWSAGGEQLIQELEQKYL